MLDLHGRVVAISGANRGIGRAIAERLIAEGSTLSLGAHDPASLAELEGETVMAHAFEATEAGAAEAWVAVTVARFGRLDGIVNNAGIAHHGSPLTVPEDDIEAMWRVNTIGPLRLVRVAWPHLMTSGSGRILDIASM